jgi:hypothetical protein
MLALRCLRFKLGKKTQGMSSGLFNLLIAAAHLD